MRKGLVSIFLSLVIACPLFAATSASYTSTKESLQNITPQAELARLKQGNTRFVTNKPIQRNFLQQAKVTSLNGQFPGAVILSCMDSRGSPELIFDQGLGDVFSVRVAGNVVDSDQLGGMEYATKVIGSKLVVVMGHTQCGAVKGACQNVELGNLTSLLGKIQPAVSKIKDAAHGNIDCANYKTVDQIAKQNVIDVMKQVEANSNIIHDQISHKQVLLVGAMHDLQSGKVVFFDENGNNL